VLLKIARLDVLAIGLGQKKLVDEVLFIFRFVALKSESLAILLEIKI
jgi:hypothetical protein